MDQEKIGKFIAQCRREKKLTQQELASRLGVSDRTIGNWENGRNMPDLSLFKQLCCELGISVNELLSGEKITKKVSPENTEENIIKTIDYGNQIINEKNKAIGIILIVGGILLSVMAMTTFNRDSSWGAISAILGGVISLVGVARFTKRLSFGKRLVGNMLYGIVYIIILLVNDYVGVVVWEQVPRFASRTIVNNMIKYRAPWYNIYQINYGTKNEYYIVDIKKEYTDETVPNVPFNRTKSGIDNVIKYKSKYLGDNSNTGNLISNLPLAEYGYTLEIEEEKLGLIINYHITDWYINENYYLEKSIIYNAVTIFGLIDNVEYIQFNFSGRSYMMTREEIRNYFPGYEEIVRNGFDKGYFKEYVEKNINDNDFVNSLNRRLFLDEKIKLTEKIVVKNADDEKVIKTIKDQETVKEMVTLMGRASKITGMINMDGNWWKIYLYDQNDEVIYKFDGWGYNGYASCFGVETKEYKIIGLDGERFTELIVK